MLLPDLGMSPQIIQGDEVCMAKTGFTMDFTDFDSKFFKIVEKTIPGLGAKGLSQGAAVMIRYAIIEPPAVPKSRGVTKPSGTRWTGPGHLRRSQKIEKPKIAHNEISIEYGFNTDYAARMHEIPFAHYSTPGTGAKYLEAKLPRHKEEAIRKVADVIKSGAR